MSRHASILAVVVLIAGGGLAQQPATPYTLTLRDAIEKGLQANLRVLAAATRAGEAAGSRERRFAGLLPRVRAESFASRQNRNLRAFGISFPGVPETVPAFSNLDFRVYADQPVIDLQAYHNWKASGEQERSTREDYQDARDLIIRQVAGLYLNAQSAAARAEAAQYRVTTADALYRLARERHDAGVATGVDVLRAQVQLADEQQRLLEARNAAKQALILLARNIGISPGAPLVLAEALTYRPSPPTDVSSLLASAFRSRPDYLSLERQRAALIEQQRANRARYYPRFSVGGNYGGIGRSLGDITGTGVLQGTVSVTLFDRDRKGEQLETANRLQRVEDQMSDLRLGIEQEIREALLNLESAAEQVAVATQGRELAQQELSLAQARFESGVTNNIEVITAQEALARAQENYILGVSRHVDAKAALARAAGGTEQNYRRYLETQ